MAPKVRMRFWLEAGAAATSAVCLLLTLAWTDWIELATGLDPDRHSGAAETMTVALSATAAIVFALLSLHERRRLAVAT